MRIFPYGFKRFSYKAESNTASHASTEKSISGRTMDDMLYYISLKLIKMNWNNLNYNPQLITIYLIRKK